ncbi:MAG: hypothetical protein HC822_18590 [Oscillochloris sp.]|nr:hypothetical protein [Oscillochloris sp.]
MQAIETIPLNLILLGAGLLLMLVALVLAAIAWRGESGLLAMRDTPTFTAAEVAERHRWALHGTIDFGEPIELAGTIDCDEMLLAPFSGTRCIAYDSAMHEERETHVGRDHYGRPIERETSGRDMHDRQVSRFYIVDSSDSRIAVDLRGAGLDMKETLARYESYTGMGGSEREIWREERAIPVGEPGYVLGYLRDDNGVPVIGADPTGKNRRFLISYRNEKALSGSLRRRAYSLYLAGGLSLGGAAVLIFLALR